MSGKAHFWIILFAALLIVCAAAFLVLSNRGFGGTVAKIYSGGELIDAVDLRSVAVAYEIVVETEMGVNTILVEPGQISVRSADCPDQLCVRQAPVSDSVVPIVCLPHRLVISVEG